MTVVPSGRPEPLPPPAPGTRGLLPNLLNIALFYGAWFGCAFGLAWGQPLLGPLSALVVLAIHLTLRQDRRAELLTILAVVVVGPFIDVSLVLLDAVRFAEPLVLGFFAPPTLLALWVVFATTFDASLGWMATRPLLAAGFAAVGGPLAYITGERLGALQLDPDLASWLVPTACLWALGFPALLRFAAWVRRAGAGSPTAD